MWDMVRFAFQKDHSGRRERDLQEVRKAGVGGPVRRFEEMPVSEGCELKWGTGSKSGGEDLREI